MTVAMADRVNKALKLKGPSVEELEPGALDDDLVSKLVNAQTKMVTERIQTRLKQNLWAEAVDAVRTGKNADAAVDRVLLKLEDAKTLRQDAGIVLGRSFSMGREQYIAENLEQVDHLEISAALDNPCCAYCRSVDGRELKPGSDDDLSLTPPLSDCAGQANCRCLKIAVYRRE